MRSVLKRVTKEQFMCTDLIRREDAIDILDAYASSVENGTNDYALYREKMQSLLSANTWILKPEPWEGTDDEA